MKPEIIYKESFIIIGLKYEGTNENNTDVLMLWKSLSSRLTEIKNRTRNVRYGYDTWTEKIKETGEFTYIAGVEVKDDADIPEGMVSVHVPSSKYAVFTINPILEDVGKTVGDIYRKWLPESGLKIADNYDFEFYNEAFKPNDENSKIYFHIPIK